MIGQKLKDNQDKQPNSRENWNKISLNFFQKMVSSNLICLKIFWEKKRLISQKKDMS